MGIIVYDLETYEWRADEFIAHQEFKPSSRLLGGPPQTVSKRKAKETDGEYEARQHTWRQERETAIFQDIESQKDELREKLAFHWYTGQIIAIGAEDLDSGHRFCEVNNPDEENGELALIRGFLAWCDGINKQYHGDGEDISLAAFFGSGFDHPFLNGRCMVHDVPLKPWRRMDVEDVLTWNRSSKQRTKLDNFAFALDQRKLGDGSEVAGMVRDKEWERLKEYCRRDVDIAASILRLGKGGLRGH